MGIHIGNDRNFLGRAFTPSDLQLIRDVVRSFPALSMTELASTLCELLDWRRPNGKLKYKECRSTLERLQSEGGITLPEVRKTAPSRPRSITVRSESDPQQSMSGTAGDYRPLFLRRLQAAPTG